MVKNIKESHLMKGLYLDTYQTIESLLRLCADELSLEEPSEFSKTYISLNFTEVISIFRSDVQIK
ncbi:hypothetical protein CEQ21_24295 [Niallia circulans]|uniref:Uncharacterized protein n=1 Tax=Niallia circulans TaxID=1397 RepID=A0A553SNE2_NIACI|nr:hypothetical protein CEQ21_24295 [Niallia circulans]